MSQATTQDYLKLHLIVLIWGFTAILGAVITLPPVEIVFFRTIMAAVMIGGWMWWRGKAIRLEGKELIKVLLTGLVIASHWILFFAAARVSNVSISLIGLATATLWASILEPIFARRKMQWFEVLLGLTVLGGLYIILQVEFEHALGLLMSVLSGLGAATFSVLNGQYTKRHSPYQITFWEMTGATVGIALLSPLYVRYISETGTLALSPTNMDWVYLFILAGVCTVYAFSVSVELMKRISAFSVNLAVNLEPIYGIVLALIFLGDSEEMGQGFYMGSLVIMLSVLSYPIMNRRLKRKALEKRTL